MKKYLSLFILIFFFSQNHISANSDIVKSPEDSTLKNSVWVLKGFFQDEAKLWTSPLKIKGKQIKFWVPVFGVTMLSLANDEKIYSEFKNYQSKHKWVSDISPVFTQGGENITSISVCGLFYLGGLAFHNEKAKQTGFLSIEALGHAGLIVTFGKLITGRQRPGYDNGKDSWHWFPASFKQFGEDPQPKYDAFPSGHTIAAWSIATVIAKQYKDCKIVPVLAYTAATCVGLSRITEDAHWMSDVIIGASLGYTIGSFVARERKNTRWTILPSAGRNSVGLTSVYKL